MEELIKIANDISRLKSFTSNGEEHHGCETKDMIELGDAILVLKAKNILLTREIERLKETK